MPTEPAASVTVSVTVNGQRKQEEVEARLLLVHFIRETLGLTGTHIGCDTSNCGACTVILDGQAVKSCTVLPRKSKARASRPSKASAERPVERLQDGFWQEHGLQCGFCTPGMIMTATALLASNLSPSEAEIRRGISGNLCRCTGYVNIVKAIQYGAAKMREQQADSMQKEATHA
jgi:carbon-monoxide dehydrogenase small subunit